MSVTVLQSGASLVPILGGVFETRLPQVNVFMATVLFLFGIITFLLWHQEIQAGADRETARRSE